MKGSRQLEDEVARCIIATAQRIQKEKMHEWESRCVACEWLASVKAMVVDILDDDKVWTPRATIKCMTSEGVDDCTLWRAFYEQYIQSGPADTAGQVVWAMGCGEFARVLRDAVFECASDWNRHIGVEIDRTSPNDMGVENEPYSCGWNRMEYCVRFGHDTHSCYDSCIYCPDWIPRR